MIAAVALGCQRAAHPRPPQPGHYVYASNADSGEISGYRLDEKTGAIAPLPGNGFLPGHPSAEALTFSPDGSFGFLRTAVEVVPFAVGADGSLAARPAVKIDGWPAAVAIHPSGRFLYGVHASFPWTLDMYALNTDGIPGKKSIAYRNGQELRDLMIDPSGERLFVFGGSHQCFILDVDRTTGALTESTAKPVHVEYVAKQQRLHPAGRFLFLLRAAGLTSRMAVMRRTGDGFEPVAGSPFALARDARSFTIDPTGRYLYVVDRKSVV